MWIKALWALFDKATCGAAWCAIMVWGGSVSAHANDQPIRAALFSIEPWAIEADDGSLQGVNVDFFDAIAQQTGLKFSYHLRPYPRMLRELENGTLDISIMYERPAHETWLRQAGFIYKEPLVLYHYKGAPLKQLTDVLGWTIAVPRGANYGPWFEKAELFDRQDTQGHLNSVDLLAYGRVDAVAGPLTALKYSLRSKRYPLSDFPYPYTFTEKRVMVHVSERRADDLPVEQISSAVKALVKSGQFFGILESYFGTLPDGLSFETQ